jgi:uncharacterized SAM-binding protein YcdF (DUF218 family)
MAFLFRWTGRALAAIGFLYVLVTIVPAIDSGIIRILSDAWNEPKGDILIVLGADTLHDMVGESSYWRSVYAARVWREQKFSQLVISGGANPGDVASAIQMKSFLVCQGIPEQSIRTETDSISTHENALYTARLLKNIPGRKVLLLSDYHAFRVYRSFRRAGLDVVPSPFPDALKRVGMWRKRWPAFIDLYIEISKIGYDKSRETAVRMLTKSAPVHLPSYQLLHFGEPKARRGSSAAIDNTERSSSPSGRASSALTTSMAGSREHVPTTIAWFRFAPPTADAHNFLLLIAWRDPSRFIHSFGSASLSGIADASNSRALSVKYLSMTAR